MKKAQRQEKDQNFINYFLNRPININEFNSLHKIINELLSLLNFENTKRNLSKFNIEILEDEDKIYKEININTINRTISISLCENITEDYFIATNITFNNELDIEFSKKLVRTEFPKRKNFIELAMRKWHYNGQGLEIKNFELVETMDYSETIPIYSHSKLIENTNHYIKCLSKNKK